MSDGLNFDDGAAAGALELQHRITMHLLDTANTLERTLNFIIDETRRELGVEYVDILFRHGDNLQVELSSDRTEEKRYIPVDGSISGLALHDSTSRILNDIDGRPDVSHRYFPRARGENMVGPINAIVAPISMEGRTIGVINVESSGRRRFVTADEHLVVAVAAQVSLAITHASLFDEDKLRREVDRLLIADTETDNDLVVEQALQSILGTLATFGFIRADAAEVLFPDSKNSSRLVVAHSTNRDAIGLRVGISSSVCGEAYRTRKSIVLGRATEHAEYQPLQEGMQCEMAIPIQLGGSQGFSIGVLNIECAEENAFSSVAQVLAERFARRVVFVLAMTKMRSDIESTMQDQLLFNAADQVLNTVHRINNHLGSVRALLRDLREDIEKPESLDWLDTRRRIDYLEEEVSQSLAIPDELRRRVFSSEVSVDVNEKVRAGIARARVPKNIKIIADLQEGLPPVACESLDLAIENIVRNAVAAMPRGGSLYVSTVLEQWEHGGPSFIVITVRDTGRGMTREEVEGLFDRRHSGHHGDGLGFGMKWVKNWVRRAHGVLDVDSEEGVGTTITIKFQIDSPGAESDSSEKPDSPVSGESGASGEPDSVQEPEPSEEG